MPPTISKETKHQSCVYGPVKSWRYGNSLGIDLLLQSSICSFNCVYCQLGDIQVKTDERKVYVSTDQLERDLKESDWESADIITISGNGEPTLALNLGEVVHMIKEYTNKPVLVLTNGTLLKNPTVRQNLRDVDVVSVKLDASNDTILQRMNRPVPGITFESIIEGVEALKGNFKGKLCLQCMFMPTNLEDVNNIAEVAARIAPDEIQLNTPKRPYPLEWHVSSRGNHDATELPVQTLRVITEKEAKEIEDLIRKTTNVNLISVYRT